MANDRIFRKSGFAQSPSLQPSQLCPIYSIVTYTISSSIPLKDTDMFFFCYLEKSFVPEIPQVKAKYSLTHNMAMIQPSFTYQNEIWGKFYDFWPKNDREKWPRFFYYYFISFMQKLFSGNSFYSIERRPFLQNCKIRIRK